MSKRLLISLIFLSLLTTACGSLDVGIDTDPPILTLTPSPTQPSPTQAPVLTPTHLPQSQPQFIAYVSDGQLLVSDVTNGVLGGTTQYTVAGESDQVTDVTWSPSGEFVAFVSMATGEPHLFYIFALGQSSPTDLGPGTSPAWSPDSQSLAYVQDSYPDSNLWITTLDNPAPRQLTFETNHAWGQPAFALDGPALIVTTSDRNNMGAQGNTSFTLEQLALDGSGTRTPLPGATPFEGLRLPLALRFSPDGAQLAFSSSYHLSACASPGAYYVTDAEGGNRRELISPSLQSAIVPGQEQYHIAAGYVWSPAGDALAVSGLVVNCDFNSSDMGKIVAGPQLSILGLDGSERLIIPALFYGLSYDRTGMLLSAAHYQDNQDTAPMVEIYSAQSGQLILSVGPGSNPAFQP